MTWMVLALSCAEMPVVTPARASTDTVKAVRKWSSCWFTMRGSPKRSRSSESMGTHTSPRPSLTMKLTASGVTFSAANTRSPSFSRCSSSTTMTIRPWRISSIACSTRLISIFLLRPAYRRRQSITSKGQKASRGSHQGPSTPSWSPAVRPKAFAPGGRGPRPLSGW